MNSFCYRIVINWIYLASILEYTIYYIGYYTTRMIDRAR